MVAIGVVLGVHRRRRAVIVAGRRHWRTEAVIVEAVGARTVVVSRAGTYFDDHPALVARPVPVETDGIEILEGGEAIELVAQLVVRHDGEGSPSVDATHREVDGDALDGARAHFDPFVGVAVAVVRVEVEGDITPIRIVADVLHVVVNRNRVVVIGDHGL